MKTRRRIPRIREARAPRVKQEPQRPGAVEARRVLVATDGSSPAQAALMLARWMEQAGTWAPSAVTVLERLPVPMAELVVAPPPVEMQQSINDGLMQNIAKQVNRFGSAGWTMDVEYGSAAPGIVDAARRRDASLIVMGLGRHGRLARLFGAETAARVARLSPVPVLAVEASTPGAPRTAVVAMDFGKSSLNAAREALRLLERPGRLHLLHVRWAFEGHTMRDEDWERTYADGVEVAFARIIDALGPQPGIRITTEFRLGSVIETVIETAKSLGADVIAAGSHNHTIADRVLIGSTPAHLLRAAPCAVLVAPPG